MNTEARQGQFVDLKGLYLKASAYDTAFARRADSYALLDRWLQAAFTTLTAFTSASAFVSFTQDNPSDGVKLTVLVLALVSAGLSALRQGLSWGSLSETYRRQGSEWTRQRNKVKDMVTHLLNGERLDMKDLDKLSEMDQALVASNPPITHEFYVKCKSDKQQDFDRDYSFTSLNR